MTTITLPHQFVWREYQLKPWDAFFKEGKRHLLLVWHRRAGKTKLAVNIIIAAAHQRVGDYYYLFPSRGQAKRVLWEGRGDDGKRFVDHFPSQLIAKVNNSELSITFKNGSVFRLLGTTLNSFEKLRGGNPFGILYDEFAEQDPQVRETLLPILARNKGWEVFIGTPRGHNHFYDLYESAKDLDSWFVQHLTIQNTRDENGLPLYSATEIEKLKKSGWSDDYIQQELYCSFEASQKGAYFAKYMKDCLEQNRIRDFLIKNKIPVYTFWDLGQSDSTVIWFVQFSPNRDKMDEILCIDYYETNKEDLSHYINYINDWKVKHRCVYGTHNLPHDGNSVKGPIKKNYIELGLELGIKFGDPIFNKYEYGGCIPRISDKRLDIEAVRGVLPRVIFHKTNCQRGIDCLRSYRNKYNSNLDKYDDKPLKDWSSHGVDAFMAMARYVQEYKPPIPIEMVTSSIMDNYATSPY